MSWRIRNVLFILLRNNWGNHGVRNSFISSQSKPTLTVYPKPIQLRFQNMPANTWKMHQGICLSLRWLLLNKWLDPKMQLISVSNWFVWSSKCLNWQPAQKESPNVKTVLVPLSHISTSAKIKMVCHGNGHYWYHPAISKPLSYYKTVKENHCQRIPRQTSSAGISWTMDKMCLPTFLAFYTR